VEGRGGGRGGNMKGGKERKKGKGRREKKLLSLKGEIFSLGGKERKKEGNQRGD